MTREEIVNSMSLQDAIQVFKDTNAYGTMDIAKSVILKALGKMPQWIPVSERLPEFTINKLVVGTQFTEDVLVYDGADFRVGYFARKDKLDCNYWVVYGEDYFEPIAWMPIVQYRASPTGAESEVGT